LADEESITPEVKDGASESNTGPGMGRVRDAGHTHSGDGFDPYVTDQSRPRLVHFQSVLLPD
jgi:hypothetical protein